MALEIVGAGLGRTGTNSMRLALDHLGFGPCHHMFEVVNNDWQLPLWEAVVDGTSADWEAIFAGYRSAVDWPSASYWRELAAHYPDAKVLLTTREPESWWRSISKTILGKGPERDWSDQPYKKRRIAMNNQLIDQEFFGGKTEDRDHVIGCFEAHNRAVEEAIPEGRRLTYRVGDGWQPLCAWLGVPVPDRPFPKSNSTAEFRARWTTPGSP